MNKVKQEYINEKCLKAFNRAIAEIKDDTPCKRLRKCTAFVFETENFYVLRSYNTYVACIEKYSATLYDVLRHEYVYTATSAQHIAKFRKDYDCDTDVVHFINRRTLRYYPL